MAYGPSIMGPLFKALKMEKILDAATPSGPGFLDISTVLAAADSMKWPPLCPHCDAMWDAHCEHVIYTFTGPVYMER